MLFWIGKCKLGFVLLLIYGESIFKRDYLGFLYIKYPAYCEYIQLDRIMYRFFYYFHPILWYSDIDKVMIVIMMVIMMPKLGSKWQTKYRCNWLKQLVKWSTLLIDILCKKQMYAGHSVQWIDVCIREDKNVFWYVPQIRIKDVLFRTYIFSRRT